ncbi:MAG: hypothetical protein ACKOX2_18330 [Microcystaceae cyanobacterium]
MMNSRGKLGVIPAGFKYFILLGIIWGLIMAPCQAETVYFQTVGQAGYRVQGTLDYSPSRDSLLTVSSQSFSSTFWHLTVNFYGTQGQLWHSYDFMASQPPNNPYLQLTFDPRQQQFQGKFDLGGSDPPSVFLKGVPGQQLQWISIDAQGQEQLLDQNRGWWAIAVVPGADNSGQEFCQESTGISRENHR